MTTPRSMPQLQPQPTQHEHERLNHELGGLDEAAFALGVSRRDLIEAMMAGDPE
jgi:hypothetical protein